jgi:hypothetical protein
MGRHYVVRLTHGPNFCLPCTTPTLSLIQLVLPPLVPTEDLGSSCLHCFSDPFALR